MPKFREFQHKLLSWFQVHGRHDLPWQRQTPYHTWLSEIMLQQTQVITVIPYFQKFIQRFPDIFHLAQASIDEVLQLWSGLGYYRRAHLMHRCAKILVEKHQGHFPEHLAILQTLPGIGPSTAAAIASLAFNQPHAIFDGNVKRVLSRVFRFYGSFKELETLAQACMPQQNCRDYTQAIMDLGATCCKPKQPLCPSCPMQTICLAYRHQEIDLLPVKTKKKKPMLKDYHFIGYYNRNAELLLVKRCQQGIWPNLWCLPEYVVKHEDKPQCEFKHTLSHQIMNIKIYLQYATPNILETGQWLGESNIKNYGLPKAIDNQVSVIFSYVKHALQLPHQVDHEPQLD